MKFDWHRFAEVVKIVAPAILMAASPALAPVASVVATAISQAEKIPGASGPEKLAYVQGIVATVAPTVPGVDPAAINAALADGIAAVVASTNIILKPKV